MAATYEAIATTTLGSAASSITFSSIANTWTDLRVVLVGKITGGSALGIQYNGDTASNYSYTYIAGDGSSAVSGRSSNITRIQVYYPVSSTIPTFLEMDIESYAGSTYKTALITQSNDLNGSGSVMKEVALWRSTSAITSVNLYAQSGDTWMAGTTATIWGIKNA